MPTKHHCPHRFKNVPFIPLFGAECRLFLCEFQFLVVCISTYHKSAYLLTCNANTFFHRYKLTMQTRMHCSRMRTVHPISYGGLCPGSLCHSMHQRSHDQEGLCPGGLCLCHLWCMLGQRPPCEQNHRQV